MAQDRWPGETYWDSPSYWLGVVTTLAFMQADLDTEANAKAGGSPVLKARLPYMEGPDRADLERFGAAVDQLNEDAQILYWRATGARNEHYEYYVEVCSTEGYQGLPPGWR